MDTHDLISWEEFREILGGYGFETVIDRKFEYRSDNEDSPKYPTFLVAAHRSKKLLLVATSYVCGGRETINGGVVYGAVLLRNLPRGSYDPLCGCSGQLNLRGVYEFDYNIWGGLVSRLNQLEEAYGFADWQNPERFLWLLDYSQVKECRGENWRVKRDEFLLGAPKWVRDFILPQA